MLVQIFACCGGLYDSITMHRIVDKVAGATTTKLFVASQIHTLYKCRDRSKLHFLVVLGADVSVNFILSNAWFK
jgi:hypothetical protein